MNRRLFAALAVIGLTLLLADGVSAANNNMNLTASMSNVAPTIDYVNTISNQNPTQNGITTIALNFTAGDINGWDDLNVTAAQCSLINGVTRSRITGKQHRRIIPLQRRHELLRCARSMD
jgi:hypothetical protein